MATNFLKKGTPVIYAYNIRPEKRETVENIKKYFNKFNVKGKVNRKENTIEMEGFVSGDSRRKGISVIALENTDVCFLSFKPGKSASKARKMLRTGKISIHDCETIIGGLGGLFPNFGNPTCSFR